MGDFDVTQIQQSITEEPKTKRSGGITKELLSKIAILVLVLIVAGGGYLIYSLKFANDPDKLTIGYSTEETFALVTLAKQKGFFEEDSVVIDYRKFKTDQDVLDALDENKIDLAVVEDIEYVMTFPPTRSQKIVASISSADSYFYLLDIKKGLLALDNLVGKSLGIIESSGNNYWLENSLSIRSEVVIKKLKPGKLAKKFANADVDSVLAKQPLVYKTENFEHTAVQSIRISAQGGKKSNTVLIVNEDFLLSNKEILGSFLKALYKAENFYIEKPEEVKDILLAQWGVEKSYLTEVLRDYEYKLVLDSRLKDEISGQYSWKTQKSRNTNNSEFVLEDIFYYPLLRGIKPEAISF